MTTVRNSTMYLSLSRKPQEQIAAEVKEKKNTMIELVFPDGRRLELEDRRLLNDALL